MGKATNPGRKAANKVTPAARLRMSDARKEALRNVSHAAFLESTSTQETISAISAACGKKPVLALYDAVRLSFIVARMAGSLPAQGNETEAQRIAHAEKLLTKYQGFGGVAPLRNGMLGRRDKEQEAAYGAARNRWSEYCKAANVAVPVAKGGGDTSKTRNQPAKKEAPAAANNNVPPSKPTSYRIKDRAELLRVALVTLQGLNGTCSKSAANCPPQLSTIITDALTAVKKLAS